MQVNIDHGPETTPYGIDRQRQYEYEAYVGYE
jgi:hypothetical protein